MKWKWKCGHSFSVEPRQTHCPLCTILPPQYFCALPPRPILIHGTLKAYRQFAEEQHHRRVSALFLRCRARRARATGNAAGTGNAEEEGALPLSHVGGRARGEPCIVSPETERESTPSEQANASMERGRGIPTSDTAIGATPGPKTDRVNESPKGSPFHTFYLFILAVPIFSIPVPEGELELPSLLCCTSF